jgi:hypothetical protein
MPVWERFAGVLEFAFGALLAYVDWLYVQRPIESEADDVRGCS